MASVPPIPPLSGAPNGKTPHFAGFCFALASRGNLWPATSGDRCADHAIMSITFTLVEGKDYTFEADGRAPALTATGLERMLEAHAAGRDVAIEIDQIVVFRLPAWWG